jgi:hypothetical protein
MGAFCPDREDAYRRISRLAGWVGLREEILKQNFDLSAGDEGPPKNCRAVFSFISEFLSTLLRPHLSQHLTELNNSRLLYADFSRIHQYICLNFQELV